MTRRWLAACCCLLVAALAGATEVKPLRSGDMAKVVAAREGRAFLVAYWSTSCSHCPKELRALGELKKRYPRLDVVLVSTDTPDEAALAAELAREYGLGGSEQWVFAEPVPERLRAELDPAWHGELPRTAFYDREHRVKAVSGVVSARRLESWAQEHGQ
jgi:thiol-disulfide isomerase/thioredoxin